MNGQKPIRQTRPAVATGRPWSTLWCAAAVLWALAAPSAAQERTKLPEPALKAGPDGRMIMQRFGDADNVGLLSRLLRDDDPLVREKATADLGETHNLAALPHIRSMLEDAAADVRCAAVGACLELDPNYTMDLITEALGAPQPQTVLAALRCVRRAPARSAEPKLRELLGRPDPLVVSAALYTMTAMGLCAGADSLQALLANPSEVVRLRAAENALLCPAGEAPVEALVKVARDGRPHARAAAMAALGKSSFASVAPLLEEAGRSSDPVLRRGAVWAYHQGGQGARIRPFLDDASPMVRLAAIRAAGELKCQDCIGRLGELLLNVPDNMAHFAARESLASIGTDAVPQQAGSALTTLSRMLLSMESDPNALRDPERPRLDANVSHWDRQRVIRNVRSCSWLLGHFKSHEAYSVQLSLVSSLPVDSQALLDLAPSLAKIGDPAAVAPLLSALKKAKDHAPGYLRVKVMGQGSHLPFSEDVTAAIVETLVDLKAQEAVPTILALVNMKVMGARLEVPPTSACRVLPGMVNEANRKGIEAAAVTMLQDRAFGRSCLFEACKMAVRLGLKGAVADLQKVVQERDGRQLIHAAAWAIQELTGATPDLPEPNRSQGEWIVTALEK